MEPQKAFVNSYFTRAFQYSPFIVVKSLCVWRLSFRFPNNPITHLNGWWSEEKCERNLTASILLPSRGRAKSEGMRKTKRFLYINSGRGTTLLLAEEPSLSSSSSSLLPACSGTQCRLHNLCVLLGWGRWHTDPRWSCQPSMSFKKATQH